jgi:hypothetical protein
MHINWMPGTGMGFAAETGSGHVLTMDGAPDGGGRNLAPRRWKPCWPAPAAARPTTWC